MSGATATQPLPPPPGARSTRRPAPRWGRQIGLVQARQPAFWLFVVATVLGGLYFVLEQLIGLLISPVGLVLSWLLLLLYIIPVALVVRWLDLYEREPRSMVIGAFLWGALVATSFSGFGNDFWGTVVTKLGGAEFASEWSAALTAPPVEEIYKYLGIVVLYLIARLEFDDLIDGFVYGALVGLGFTVAEDLYYFIFVFGGDVAGVLAGFYVRVIASGLYGHVLYTGLAGIGLAYFVTHRADRSFVNRFLVAAGMLLLAMVAHFFWNSPIFDDLPILLYGVVKGMPFLIGLAILLYLARRREHAALANVLAGEVGGPGLSPTELQLLRDRRARRAARAAIASAGGSQAVSQFGKLQKEQLNLAMVASGVDSLDDARLYQQRSLCRSLRAPLLQLPAAAAALGFTADQALGEQSAMAFRPDRATGPNGAWAWATPDQRDARRMTLGAGLPLATVETRGDWMLVRNASGWHGWTGTPYLVEASTTT